MFLHQESSLHAMLLMISVKMAFSLVLPIWLMRWTLLVLSILPRLFSLHEPRTTIIQLYSGGRARRGRKGLLKDGEIWKFKSYLTASDHFAVLCLLICLRLILVTVSWPCKISVMAGRSFPSDRNKVSRVLKATLPCLTRCVLLACWLKRGSLRSLDQAMGFKVMYFKLLHD